MLTLRFKKTLDAGATLTLIRPDGSSSWSQIGAVDGPGPVQDLAHVVVERQLRLVNGYLNLVARGASFADFERGASSVGPDAVRAEAIAELLAFEAGAGRRLTLADFNDAVTTKCSELRPGYRVPELTPSALHGLRSEFMMLRREWEALAP